MGSPIVRDEDKADFVPIDFFVEDSVPRCDFYYVWCLSLSIVRALTLIESHKQVVLLNNMNEEKLMNQASE